MELLTQVNQQNGITVLVTLHQVDFAIKYCPRTVALQNGEIVYDGPSSGLTPTFLRQIYGAASEEMFAHPLPQQKTAAERQRAVSLACSAA
jgi:phosphonate transport system ATP-binding protein